MRSAIAGMGIRAELSTWAKAVKAADIRVG
jgi:hypothetical protein